MTTLKKASLKMFSKTFGNCSRQSVLLSLVLSFTHLLFSASHAQAQVTGRYVRFFHDNGGMNFLGACV